jgi:hypothetical protein
MTRRPVLAGVGGIAFSVLTIVALFLANPPGGTYKASDAAKYVRGGHHAAVFVSVYLVTLAIFGLVFLLAYLRDVVLGGPDGARVRRVFWGTGLAAAACLAVGWGIAFGDAIAHAYGGKSVVVAPVLTYLVSEVGAAIIWGPGGILLGIALITLMLGSRTTLPAWLRWSTLVAGLGGFASAAFFPSALLILWGIAIGVWLLIARPAQVRSEA